MDSQGDGSAVPLLFFGGRMRYNIVKYNSVKWCYELYPDDVLDVVNRLLIPYSEPLTEENLNIFQVK